MNTANNLPKQIATERDVEILARTLGQKPDPIKRKALVESLKREKMVFVRRKQIEAKRFRGMQSGRER